VLASIAYAQALLFQMLFGGCLISWIQFYFFLQSPASSFFSALSEGWEESLVFFFFSHVLALATSILVDDILTLPE
jgi:hypothetical protein